MRFVHIGIHKTASTLLQRELFSGCGLAVVGTPSAPDRLHQISRRLWSRDNGHLDLDDWRTEFASATADASVDAGQLALSDENLSGHMWSGAGSVTIADRLAALWPRTRILIVLRDPIDYIMSAFDEQCRLGGAAPLRQVLTDRSAPGASILRRIDFSHLVAAYTDRFPVEDVLVLPYEMLLREPARFVALVQHHCGVTTTFAPEHAITWNPRSPSLVRQARRLSNFVGIGRDIEWDRPRRMFALRQGSADRQLRRSRARVERILAKAQDIDGLLPDAAEGARGYTWPEPLCEYQGRYQWTDTLG